jgi:Fe-S-cluster containining protein
LNNRQLLLLISGIDWLNHKITKSKKLEEWLWTWYKLEGFFIVGQCQHSGHCCKKIMIYKNEIPIKTQSEFIDFQKSTPSTPFIPSYNPSNPTLIDCFDCKNLSNQNTCKDYQNRPKACRNYPYSNILNETPLFHGCGYTIQNAPKPKWIHQNLRKKIDLLEKKICSPSQQALL